MFKPISVSKFQYSWVFILIGILILTGCESNNSIDPNPFSNVQDSTVLTDTLHLDTNSIASIYKEILRPNCANSGCHDGNFEPDFRTIESSYASLVLKKPLKNDNKQSFQYRVVPGEPNKSILVTRLTQDLNGNSGIMPLVVEPNSNYNSMKSRYIQRISRWISDGCIDPYGNKPVNNDYPPEIQGVIVKQNDVMLNRVGIYEPALASTNSTILEILFSISDDFTSPEQFKNCTFNYSTHPDSFSVLNEQPLELISPISGTGLFNKPCIYQWKSTISMVNPKENDVVWFRISITDASQTVTLPNNFSMFSLKKYFAVKFQ